MKVHPCPLPSSVEVAESMGEWFVRVTDEGASTIHTFERQAFALTYAEEQRARLGLDHIEVIDDDESDLPSGTHC